jgi:c-di-GMP-related signal transduction protein
MSLKTIVNNLVEMVNDLERNLAYQEGKYHDLLDYVEELHQAHNHLIQELLKIPHFKEMDHNEFFDFCKKYKLIN